MNSVSWCTCGARAAIVWVVLLLTPAAAHADGLVTVFGGASFGDNDSEKVGTLGLSLAGMAGGVFGFEVDFGRTDTATTDAVFVTDSRTTTLTGNILIGIPLGAVRPYVVGGLGLVRTEAEAVGGATERVDGLGVDFGGGLMGFFGEHVGGRVDLRYFRAVSTGDGFLDFEFEQLHYVRFTGGLILRFS